MFVAFYTFAFWDYSPICMSDLFNSWSKLGTKKYNSLLLTAAAALLWLFG